MPILSPCVCGKADQVGQPRHGAVVFHDLADHAGGLAARKARDIDRRLGMAGAHQHAAVAGAQREDVTRRRDMRGAVCLVDRHGDGQRAVGGGNAGADALARLDLTR